MRYNAPTIRLACKGIDLKSAIDALGEGRYRILTNVLPTEEFGLVSIPGTRRVNGTALGSVALHSLGFLNAPTSTSRLLAGAGTALYDVNSLASLASGFSGNPLSMVPYRLSGSGLPWMIVGDSNKMVKVSPSGQVYQVGITAPTTAATTVLGTPYNLTVQTFNTDSGFTYFSGGSVPTPTHTTIAGQVGNAIQMTTTCSTVLGYFGISEALTVNMNSFGAGNPAIQDTDYISLWVKVSDPTLIQEIRILFDLDSGLGFNQNFYFASVRTSDIQQALEYQTTVSDTSVGASMNIRTQAMLEGLPQGIAVPYQPSTLLNEQVSAGQNQWTKITLTRGSFQRVGGDSTLDWSNVNGIAVVAVTTEEASAPSVSVAVNNLIVFGGYAINASLGVPYDWRFTYQDSVTLSESNPSSIQASTAFLSPQVAPVTVTAPRSADPQVNTIRFWRRGGTLGDNWYLVGTVANPASGSASITDGAGDSTIASAAILSLTNDQPFTTLGASGAVTLGTPLPCLFGPYNGNVIFAVGDPNNPGFLYWCNAANPDAAASTQNVEVSQSSDPLMNGCIWDNQPFVATETTWYRVVPSQIGAPNQFQGLPTGAQHGLPKGANWAFIPTPVGIAYASNDGVYLMANGPEQMLGALDLWPLFNGEAKEIYQPIDFTHPEKIRFAFFDSEIWFGYQDTAGQQNWWTFHVFKKDGWKNRQYPWNPAVVYGEPEQENQSLLLGGNNGCYSYDTEVLTDNGWKLFRDVDISKDRIATRSLSGALEFQLATHYFCYPFRGEMVHFNSRGVDFLVTPDHRMIYGCSNSIDCGRRNKQKRKRKGFSFIFAEDLYKIVKNAKKRNGGRMSSSLVFPCTSSWVGREIQRMVFTTPPGLPVSRRCKTIESFEMSGDEFCAFMGAYLSEGCTIVAPGSYRISISQSKKSKGYDLFNELISRIAPKAKRRDGIQFLFANRPLWFYLRKFGYSQSKYVPEEIKNSSSRQIKIFLEYFGLGDGSIHRKRLRIYSYSTSSKKLADDLQELCQKAGLNASVRSRVRENGWSVEYIVNTLSSPCRSYTKVEKYDYEGPVYCAEVPNGTLLVRRNGYAGWCGNCVYVQDYSLATHDGAAITGHIRTGSFNFGAPHSEKEFGGLVVDANTSGANLAVDTLFGYEGTTQSLGNVAVASRQPIPLKIADTYSTDCVIDLQFTSTVLVSVYSLTPLWRPDAVPVVHWESQAEGFGIGGWAHCYDSYITVRSSADIILTLEVDGQDIPTVTLPSTSGARYKLYVQWPLNKGKVFRPIADSSAPFRLYLEDTFFNFSAWNGGSPQQIQCLGGIYPGDE